MRTQGVEVNAPLLNEHPRFTQAVEQLPIEPLIPKLAVKALAIPVLPWAAWCDVGGVSAQALEPIPEYGGHKLWPVIASDEFRHTTLEHQIRQHINDINCLDGASHVKRQALPAEFIDDAVYENQPNIREAKRVVDAVVEHIATRPEDSLGIVTLNIKQRDLISELMEERLRSIFGADEFKEKWAVAGQPLFVKNLENVQGDERDAIFISTTFGKPPGSSAVRQNFGPISRQGGWSRLNVLFTRAKKSVAVYTSLRPEDIVDDSSTPEGTKALRNYLEFARSGMLTVATQTNLDPDSDFEVSVMDMLKARGYEVTPQLGVAGYRIDIAVKHPDAPGAYLAAVECDGATYHSALSVRDRDRIRQEILESLGWRGRIWRIWSTDWFRTPRQESEKLISFLESLRNSWKPEHVSENSWVEESDKSSLISPITSNPDSKEVFTQTDLDLNDVSNVLIADDDDLEVAVGDVVRYSDFDKPLDILTVQISRGNDDFENGIVNESRPLAQILIGAVVGDEVTLHLPGSKSRVFQIVEIIKG